MVSPVWMRASSGCRRASSVSGMRLMARMRSPPRMPARIVGLFGNVISTRPGPSAAGRCEMKNTPAQPRASQVRITLIVHAAPAASRRVVKVRPMAIRRAGLMTLLYGTKRCRLPVSSNQLPAAGFQLPAATGNRQLSIPLPAAVHDRHEFLPRPLVLQELAAEDVRLHERRLLLHAAHHHAEMDAAHPDGDAARLEDLLDRVRDVVREMLLRLQPAHVYLDHARDLRRADDRLLRDVADDEAAEERQDVVRAERLVRPADHHEVVAALVGARADLAE